MKPKNAGGRQDGSSWRARGAVNAVPAPEARRRLAKSYLKALRAVEMAAWEDPTLLAAARKA